MGNNKQADVLMLNDGQGGFSRRDDFPENAWERTRCLAIGDIDADGDLDVVIGTEGANLVPATNKLLVNDGSGGFAVQSAFDANTANDPTARTEAVVLGDVNNDSWLDIVFGNYERPNQLLLNDQSGGFFEVDAFPATNNTFTRAAVLVDANGGIQSSALTRSLAAQRRAGCSCGPAPPVSVQTATST